AHRPEVQQALKKCVGVFMPSATQDLDGIVTVNLGSKGVIELELVSDGAKWGRGPAKDIHSSLKAMIDSPAWRLVHALNTLVSEDGNTIKIDNYPKPRPLSAEEKAMIASVSKVRSEANAKKQFSTQHWIDDLPWQQANERLESRPTVNIEGLVGGYTGQGGKTILPHRAVAKMDFRLVPDMTVADCLPKLRAHLDKRGFSDVEVNMTGGYDPNTTPSDAATIRAEMDTYKKYGIDALLWPRLGGSWPGYVFTEAPLKLPAGHVGLGQGRGGAFAVELSAETEHHVTVLDRGKHLQHGAGRYTPAAPGGAIRADPQGARIVQPNTIERIESEPMSKPVIGNVTGPPSPAAPAA